jgi:hypothetical protein
MDIDSTPSRFAWLTNLGKKKIIIIASIVGIAFIAIFVTLFYTNTSSGDESASTGELARELFRFRDRSAEQDAQNAASISRNTLVYGVWRGNESVILAQDLQSGETYTLAELVENVKHIEVLDNDHLLFIANTDQYDRGDSIVRYTISANESEVIYQADPGLGIDDYVVSPNKQFIAAWEARNGLSGHLADGRSAVYSLRLLEKGVKRQIYSQQSGDLPFYYPRAITNSGDIFMDGFIPNIGSGWAKGMSVSNFLGTEKEVLANMQMGTYGTQPVASPDGKYLAFAGYDRSGDPYAGNDFERAIIRPNTIELLDTATRQRSKLKNVSNANIYPGVMWDTTSNNVLFQSMSASDDESGWLLYDRQNATVDAFLSGNTTLVRNLSDDKRLGAILDDNPNVIANLGPTYAQLVQKFYTVDANGEIEDIISDETMMHYISVLPSAYFRRAVDAATSVQAVDSQDAREDIPSAGCGALDSLQLCPFFFKVNLAAERLKEQANPVKSLLGKIFPVTQPKSTTGGASGCTSGLNEQCNPTELPGCYVTEVKRCQEIRAEVNAPKPTMGGTNTNPSNSGNSSNTSNSGGNNNKNNNKNGGKNKGGGNNKGKSKANSTDSVAIVLGNPGTTQEKCDVILDYHAKNPTYTVGPTFGSGGIDGVGACYGSPLYLYGPLGANVHVNIGVPIANDIPKAQGNTYDVTLGDKGIMYINGGRFESIAYDYIPALKRIHDPEKGTIVARKDVPRVMAYYAKRLSLNEKETKDLTAYGEKQVISPYAFVSFFDHETSHKILPLSFSPEPDNYRNIVIFIRLLRVKPPFSVEEPDFPKPLERSGFTAVEISGIVR